jgi:hypothetical protein
MRFDLCVNEFCKKCHCFVKQFTVSMRNKQKVSQNGHPFFMFHCFTTKNQLLRRKPLFASIKSTAASLFCYCLAKGSGFCCLAKRLMICWRKLFAKQMQKQVKNFAKLSLVLLVLLFHETTINHFVKNPNRMCKQFVSLKNNIGNSPLTCSWLSLLSCPLPQPVLNYPYYLVLSLNLFRVIPAILSFPSPVQGYPCYLVFSLQPVQGYPCYPVLSLNLFRVNPPILSSLSTFSGLSLLSCPLPLRTVNAII